MGLGQFMSRAPFCEFGAILADHVSVRVHDSNADMRYLVMPKRPAGTEGWNILHAELVTRDSMITSRVPNSRLFKRCLAPGTQCCACSFASLDLFRL